MDPTVIEILGTGLLVIGGFVYFVVNWLRRRLKR